MNDKVVLVTGSSSGIGRETAILFAKKGAKVVVTGRNDDAIKEVVQICERESPKQQKHLGLVADLTNPEKQKYLIDQTVSTFGQLDILVNNAGFHQLIHFKEANFMDNFDKVLNGNLRVTVALTHLAAPHLIKAKGVVINVSSVAAITPAPGWCSYAIAKAGMDMFTKAMSLELAPEVRVVSVNPGYTKTNFFKSLGFDSQMEEAMEKNCAELAPLKRSCESLEVAEAILFLASDKANFITGTHLVVDGGILNAAFNNVN